MSTHSTNRQRVGTHVEVWMEFNGTKVLLAQMERKGLSKLGLAKRAGCSNTMIHLMLKGERKSCTPKLARQIAEAVDLPIAALFAAHVSIDGDDSTPVSVKESAA